MKSDNGYTGRVLFSSESLMLSRGMVAGANNRESRDKHQYLEPLIDSPCVSTHLTISPRSMSVHQATVNINLNAKLIWKLKNLKLSGLDSFSTFQC